MSLTNHIIIPIVGSKQNLQDQNIFVPASFTITPSKHDELPDFTFWKKSSSAFKRFKQKKDKKISRHLPTNQNQQPQQQLSTKYLKLKQTQRNLQTYQHYHQQAPYGYYDPNEAPLYEMHYDNEADYAYRVKENKLKIDESVQQIKLQRIQSEIIDQEPKFIIQPRFDDPFIIIRKDHKKNQKAIKTKNIKKDKNGKSKQIDQIKLVGGKIIENHKNAVGMANGVNHSFTAPILIKSKTSEPIIIDQSSSNSLQSEQENHSPQNGKKQIHTIQHLMNLSKPKPTENAQSSHPFMQCNESMRQQQQKFIQ